MEYPTIQINSVQNKKILMNF